MRQKLMAAVTLASIILALALVSARHVAGQDDERLRRDDDNHRNSRVEQGFAIAPVPLNLEGRNRALVGLGSYIVNAQSTCSDCHTSPAFKPGGNPFLGEPELINTDHYLAGGRVFGPQSNPLHLTIISPNITPNAVSGLPANLTFEQFQEAFQEGVDPDGIHPRLQVMPWPSFGKMNERDVRAVYEYLSAIPHAGP